MRALCGRRCAEDVRVHAHVLDGLVGVVNFERSALAVCAPTKVPEGDEPGNDNQSDTAYGSTDNGTNVGGALGRSLARGEANG